MNGLNSPVLTVLLRDSHYLRISRSWCPPPSARLHGTKRPHRTRFFPNFSHFNLRRRGLESCFGVHHHPGGGIALPSDGTTEFTGGSKRSSESAGLARQRDSGRSSGPGHGLGRLAEAGTETDTGVREPDRDLDLHFLANGRRAEVTFPRVGGEVFLVAVRARLTCFGMARVAKGGGFFRA